MFTFLSLGFGVFRNGGEGIKGKIDFIGLFVCLKTKWILLGFSQLIIYLPTPALLKVFLVVWILEYECIKISFLHVRVLILG